MHKGKRRNAHITALKRNEKCIFGASLTSVGEISAAILNLFTIADEKQCV